MLKLKTSALLLFIFTFPYENWNPFGISDFVRITKLAGLISLSVSTLRLRNSFRLGVIFKPLKILLLLWIWILIQSVLNYWSEGLVSIFSFTFLWNIIFFWLISNDILENPKLINKIFLTLISSVFFLSILTSFGIGIDSEHEITNTRLLFFGTNPNTIGSYCSTIIVLIIGMVINKSIFFNNKTFLLLGFIPSILLVMAITGSLGALGMVIIGVAFLFLMRKTSNIKRVFTILFGVVIIFYGFKIVLDSSEIMKRRLAEAQIDKNLGERTGIWTEALNLFQENPIAGIGTSGYEFEMLERRGEYSGTHNLFLYFLVTGGFVGLSLYLFFLRIIIQSVMTVYKKYNIPLFMTLFLLYIINLSKSGGIINSKFMWLLLAISFTSKYILEKNSKRRVSKDS